MKRQLRLYANYLFSTCILFLLIGVLTIPVHILLYLRPHFAAYAACYAYDFAIWLVYAGIAERDWKAALAEPALRMAFIIVGISALLLVAVLEIGQFSAADGLFASLLDGLSLPAALTPMFCLGLPLGVLLLFVLFRPTYLFRWGLDAPCPIADCTTGQG